MRFARAGLEMPRANEKQAVFPSAAEIIPNPVGTAPGFCLRSGGKLLFFLPGIPRELRHLFLETVLPRLESERKESLHYRSRVLKVFGLTESAIADRLREVDPSLFYAEISYLPRYPENHVKVVVRGVDPAEVEGNLAKIESAIREKLEGRIFATDRETLEEIVGRLLKERQATLAVAESCTGRSGGPPADQCPRELRLLRKGIGDVQQSSQAGSSRGSRRAAGQAGCGQRAVAEKMAEGARLLSRSTLGLGITGIAGPGGGTPEKPVGTVFIALAGSDGTAVKGYRFWGTGSK